MTWADYADEVISMQIPDNLYCPKNKPRLFKSLRGRSKSSTIQDLAIGIYDVANTGAWNGIINHLKSLQGEKQLSPMVKCKVLFSGPIKSLDSGYGTLSATTAFNSNKTKDVAIHRHNTLFKIDSKFIYLTSAKTVRGESDCDVDAMVEATIRICNSIRLRT